MKIEVQIPIILSLVLIWLAQIAYTPIYISIILMVMLIVLYMQFRKSTNRQSVDTDLRSIKWIKAGLVILALLAVYLSFGSFIGVEAGTAVLAIFLFGKSLELKSKRDLIIFFNFALFVSASLFLHSQAMWMAVLVILCLVSCLFGLYRIQLTDFTSTSNQHIKAAKKDIGHIFKFVGLAVPFFVILFLFFPRFPPLWHVPIQSDQAVTGLSDQMSPGDIAELSQSSALAFRIITDLKQLPAQHELYWRAMALDQYDGRIWTSHFSNQNSFQFDRQELAKQGIPYQYLPADMRQKWITSLEKSVPVERRLNLNQDYSITPNRLVQRNQPIALVWLGADFNNQNIELDAFQKRLYTQVPNQFDVKAQTFAQELYRKSQSNPNLYIQNVIDWYQTQNFKYSLKPGRLGEQRIDEFLFKTKEGFCEHYASSFVMLMRYVGIPARVVVGYQGGQAAPDAKSWEVRQLDAHAWTEVLVQGQWKRIDPTAMIAPQRLDLGMQDYISNDRRVFGEEQFSNFKYQQFSMLKQFRIWSDYATFQWQDKVIGFDSQRQQKWLQWFGFHSSYASAMIIFIGIIGFGLLYLAYGKFKAIHQQSRAERIISRFSKHLTTEDQKKVGESFKSWMWRLKIKYSLAFDLTELLQHHQNIVYLDQRDSQNLNSFENSMNSYTNILKQHKKTCQQNQK